MGWSIPSSSISPRERPSTGRDFPKRESTIPRAAWGFFCPVNGYSAEDLAFFRLRYSGIL